MRMRAVSARPEPGEEGNAACAAGSDRRVGVPSGSVRATSRRRCSLARLLTRQVPDSAADHSPLRPGSARKEKGAAKRPVSTYMHRLM